MSTGRLAGTLPSEWQWRSRDLEALRQLAQMTVLRARARLNDQWFSPALQSGVAIRRIMRCPQHAIPHYELLVTQDSHCQGYYPMGFRSCILRKDPSAAIPDFQTEDQTAAAIFHENFLGRMKWMEVNAAWNLLQGMRGLQSLHWSETDDERRHLRGAQAYYIARTHWDHLSVAYGPFPSWQAANDMLSRIVGYQAWERAQTRDMTGIVQKVDGFRVVTPSEIATGVQSRLFTGDSPNRLKALAQKPDLGEMYQGNIRNLEQRGIDWRGY